MISQTMLVVLASLVILGFLFAIVVLTSYREGILIFDVVYDHLRDVIEKFPLLSGDMTEWPEWAI